MSSAGRARRTAVVAIVMVMGACLLPAGCSDADDVIPAGSSEFTGQACKVAADCYGWLDGGELLGERMCLDRVPGGYCTHLCETDSDCCGVQGECRTRHPQVCAPFESTGLKMCFLSCEESDVRDAGVVGTNQTWDSNWYCQTYAWTGFGCRSTGGGAENRKVCVP